jgi:hypothetical protein
MGGIPVGPPQGGTPGLPVAGQPAPLGASEFKSNSIPQLTTFNLSQIAPPSQVYIGRDDLLLLQAYTSIPGGDTVTFNIRVLEAIRAGAFGGQPDTPPPPPNSNQPLTSISFGSTTLQVTTGVVASQVVTLAEGFLLSIGTTSGTSTQAGITTARATLIRGGQTASSATLELFADYVTPRYSAGWPTGRIARGREGAGKVFELAVGSPGAGADWNVNISGGQALLLRQIRAILTTSATAASRIPRLFYTNGGSTLACFTPNNFIPASTTANVTCSNGSVPAVVAGCPDIVIGISNPLWVLGPSGNINVGTLNLQAADQWSNIVIVGEMYTNIDG